MSEIVPNRSLRRASASDQRSKRLHSANVLAIIAGVIVIAFAPLPQGGNEHIRVGLLIGSTFGHAVLAALWCGLGPGPPVYRVPLSLLWIAALVVAWSINITIQRYGDLMIVLLMGSCAVSIWVLLQIPLAMIRIVGRLHIGKPALDSSPTSNQSNQFGIRHLLLFTTLIAILLGAVRLSIPLIPKRLFADIDGFVIFGFLATAAMLSSLPLALALLMPRYWVAAAAVLLALIAIGTYGELPLFELAFRQRGGGPKLADFISLNAFTIGWVILVACLTRLAGYRTTFTK